MVIVIGAGISGLTTARELKAPCIILEKDSAPGGLAGQYERDGYRFDHSGHYFHFKNRPGIRQYLESIIDLDEYRKNSRVFIGNRFIPFPIQHHIGYLPRSLACKIYQQLIQPRSVPVSNLEDQLVFSLGESLYELFFRPFLRKYYQRDPASLPPQPDDRSIPIPSREAVELGFHKKRIENVGYNPVFYYPKPSLKDLIERMSELCRDHLHLNEPVQAIDSRKRLVITDSSRYPYSTLVSTIPLNRLLTLLDFSPVRDDPLRFDYVSTLVVNIVVEKRRRRFHWVYLPEKATPFFRLGYYPARRPPICYMECNLKPDDETPELSLEKISSLLKKLGVILTEREILHVHRKIIPISYVLPDGPSDSRLAEIHHRLASRNIYSIGRYGAWRYSSMSDDMSLALETVRRIREDT